MQMKFNNNKRLILSWSLVTTLFFLTTIYPSRGQMVQKQQLKETDYASFGRLEFDKSSNDGHWASFYMTYSNGKDTLFVKNTTNVKKYSFTSSSNTSFVGNQHFVYTTKAGLHILNLENGQQQHIPQVTSYTTAMDFNQLIVLSGMSTSEKELLILDLYGNIKKKITRVVSFKISPAGNELVYVTKSDGLFSLGLLNLAKLNDMQWIVEKSPNDFKNLTWEKRGRSLAFLNKSKASSDKSSLFYYRTDHKLRYEMDPEKQLGFPKDRTLDNLGFRFQLITISDDLNRVFFGIGPIIDPINAKSGPNLNAVEIWNGNDKWIYPMEKNYGQFEKKPNLAVWSPLSGAFTSISSASLPKAMLTGNEQYAILSNPQAYEPQFEREGPVDYYILNLQTKDKELLLKKHPSNVVEYPIASPGGKYVTYMLKNSCWVYSLSTKSHIEVGRDLADKLKPQSIFSLVGWTPNDKELILSDQYDIWIAAPDGSYCKRLTHGREKQIQFKIYEHPSLIAESSNNYDGRVSKIISVDNGFLLEAKGADQKTGYYKWEKNKGEAALVYKDSYIDKLQILAGGKVYIFQEQKFDQSPKLMFLNGNRTTTLFQSNVHQANYHWGKAQLIDFQNSNGKLSRALLYYPAAYDPAKKYPMVVKIYEKQTQNLYKFENPTMENQGGGFNPTVLTSQGYFVLCPDIIRENQNEGPSALAATVSSVKEVIAMGLVYPNKIGLMGHSFGGFETNYIITQTGLFAAAVAGSPINNIRGFYHTVNWRSGFPSMNYFKSGQLMMDQSPYEIPDIYARNSPIEYADKITTPLLAYTGKEDNHVDWHQSVEFYMALRRLNKKHMMLLYPEEGHVLLKPTNQIDLSQRILQWFNYFLKDDKSAEWIANGMAPVQVN